MCLDWANKDVHYIRNAVVTLVSMLEPWIFIIFRYFVLNKKPKWTISQKNKYNKVSRRCKTRFYACATGRTAANMLHKTTAHTLWAGNSESPLLPPVSVNAKGKRKVLLLNVSTERGGGGGGEEEESLRATCEWQASLKGRLDSGSANSIL